jgi:cobalt/nickel transport system permease protein
MPQLCYSGRLEVSFGRECGLPAMHIPDGYLSPSSCATLFAAAGPFWYVAFARVKRLMHTRLVPLLAVTSAFCFVIMMFNVPLPGGTTGHAVGVGAATVVLGPWAAMLSLSVALLIQALFFGDGGITTLGANCFNMAIVGSLVAHMVYRIVAGKTPLASSRRIAAGALAGYTAINASAFLAACELGMQPMFFKDTTGGPLYAPYSLHIAIPAMMIGHLTFAGLAEFFVSGGVVAYLQRAHPALLDRSSGRVTNAARPSPARSGWGPTAPLWIRLALLMLLTPLGILAAGTAWGEWSVRDFSNPEARQKIASASSNVAPPAQQPRGLARLSSVWSAPFPQYAPPFVRRPTFGYVMSAMFGSGLILGAFLLMGRVFGRESVPTKDSA